MNKVCLSNKKDRKRELERWFEKRTGSEISPENQAYLEPIMSCVLNMPQVKAVEIGGSWMKNTARIDSDLDVRVTARRGQKLRDLYDRFPSALEDHCDILCEWDGPACTTRGNPPLDFVLEQETKNATYIIDPKLGRRQKTCDFLGESKHPNLVRFAKDWGAEQGFEGQDFLLERIAEVSMKDTPPELCLDIKIQEFFDFVGGGVLRGEITDPCNGSNKIASKKNFPPSLKKKLMENAIRDAKIWREGNAGRIIDRILSMRTE